MTSAFGYSLRANVLHRIILVVLVVFGATWNHASAYSVSPLVIDKTLTARDTEEVAITVTNSDSIPVRIFPTVNAIALDTNGTISEFISPSLADSKNTVTTWLAISRARIEVMPGEAHETQLTIKLPPAVEPGTYHAFIGFPEGDNRPQAEAKVAAGGVPGVVVTIDVTKDSVTILRLSRFFIDRFVTDGTPKVASISFMNGGTEEVLPRGEIIFYDTTGTEIAAAPFNTESTQVEPGTDKSFEVPLPENLGFGKYKAFLDVEYGGAQTAQLQDTTFFYIVPLRELLVLFFALLMVTMFLAWRVHKRYARFEDEYEVVSSVPVTVRTIPSEAKDHDIDLKKPQM